MGAMGLGFIRRRSVMRAFSSASFRPVPLLRDIFGSSSRSPFPPSGSAAELGILSSSFHTISTRKGLPLVFTRSFSDSPNDDSKDPGKSAASSSIKPISYPVKPKDASSASSPPEEIRASPSPPPPRRLRTAGPRQQAAPTERLESEAREWTRQDIRYVKDAPAIAPVSYPTRVAPLPEDRVFAEEAKDEAKAESKVEVKEESEEDRDGRKAELEKETRSIQREVRVRRLTREEEESLPFPTLLRPEKGKTKAVMDLQEAIKEVKAHAKRKFTETLEAHVSLGVDPRRGDQMVRGAITLPHGTGKVVRVAVFAEGSAADEARAAGADIVGGDELIEQIKNGGGKLNFDKCIAVPSFMPRLGKIARILGPRGLMPNPKLGSLTNDVTSAVQEAKRGRVDFKIDKTAIVHVGLGKVNFADEALRENVGAFVNALLLAKPVGLKKTSKYAGYVNSFTLCSTMGPGFPVSIQSLSMAADHYSKLKLQ
ncbi:50S ribosomal protein L1 [Nymphaea thermarum]|nr:50S ribosomal protein L1 [Nymphaea thermarum]